MNMDAAVESPLRPNFRYSIGFIIQSFNGILVVYNLFILVIEVESCSLIYGVAAHNYTSILPSTDSNIRWYVSLNFNFNPSYLWIRSN